MFLELCLHSYPAPLLMAAIEGTLVFVNGDAPSSCERECKSWASFLAPSYQTKLMTERQGFATLAHRGLFLEAGRIESDTQSRASLQVLPHECHFAVTRRAAATLSPGLPLVGLIGRYHL